MSLVLHHHQNLDRHPSLILPLSQLPSLFVAHHLFGNAVHILYLNIRSAY